MGEAGRGGQSAAHPGRRPGPARQPGLLDRRDPAAGLVGVGSRPDRRARAVRRRLPGLPDHRAGPQDQGHLRTVGKGAPGAGLLRPRRQPGRIRLRDVPAHDGRQAGRSRPRPGGAAGALAAAAGAGLHRGRRHRPSPRSPGGARPAAPSGYGWACWWQAAR
ncbi:hypothetical protein [Nonomuraea dietziae]|uniref:hypothetical protein n=1 Tax=Nonomuraea dietziae TaxID=65515 RepID=UPI0031E07C9C